MKRPEPHVMEDKSFTLLKSLVDECWIVRSLPKDYGVDCELEYSDNKGDVTGQRIWVQLKAVRRLTRCLRVSEFTRDFWKAMGDKAGSKREGYFAFPMATEALSYAMKCPFPFLLMVADLAAKDVFWVAMRDEITLSLAVRDPEWERKKTVTLRIPPQNRLSLERKRGFPGLRWYAGELSRLHSLSLLNSYHREYAGRFRARLANWEKAVVTTEGMGGLQEALIFVHHWLSLALELEAVFGATGFQEVQGDYRSGVLPRERAIERLSEGKDAAWQTIRSLRCKEPKHAAIEIASRSIERAMEVILWAIEAQENSNERFVYDEFQEIRRLGRLPVTR